MILYCSIPIMTMRPRFFFCPWCVMVYTLADGGNRCHHNFVSSNAIILVEKEVVRGEKTAPKEEPPLSSCYVTKSHMIISPETYDLEDQMIMRSYDETIQGLK